MDLYCCQNKRFFTISIVTITEKDCKLHRRHYLSALDLKMKCGPPNESQLRTMAPSMSSPFAADLDLTYCTVKTGVNDFLDYIAIVISLVIPLILGPGLAGVGQVREIQTGLPKFYARVRSLTPLGPSTKFSDMGAPGPQLIRE